MATSFYGMAISMLWLLFINGEWMLYAFVVFYGMCYGIRAPAHLGILSDFFGTRAIGMVIGIAAGIGQSVGAFAPFLAGFIFDQTGSYRLAFLIVLCLLLVGGAVASIMKKPVATPEAGL